MRASSLTTACLTFPATLLLAADPASPLERSAGRWQEAVENTWSTAATCTISYYNVCTDWIYLWSGWNPGDRFGVVYDAPCGVGGQAIVGSRLYCQSAAPAGYGFTGVMVACRADVNGCPVGTPWMNQPFLPVDRWNEYLWGLAEVFPLCIVVEFGPAPNVPTRIASDHPATGCGTCYPASRRAHSFLWGSAGAPLCPGDRPNDGICNAEWLQELDLAAADAVDASSWGKVKSLYR